MKNRLNAVLKVVDPRGSVGHKDVYLTCGVETTAASKVLEGYLPQYSATLVLDLEKAGYKTKAKLNLDAWAHGASGENSAFGPTKNPWNPIYSPGGSSSGSAAAVASKLVEFATGTDTGGSIRLPASFTNTTALKPTYGALSRYGIIAMASSTDCPSIIARDVAKLKQIYKILAHQDPQDPNTHSQKRSELNKTVNKKKLSIGLPKEYFTQGLDKEVKGIVKNAANLLEKNGFKINEISLPHTKYGIAVYYLIMTTEVASNLARYDGIRYGNDRSHFGLEAKRRILLGTFASQAGYAARYYHKAANLRTLIIKDFKKAFKDIDLILAPVSPTPPFKLGERSKDPLKMYLSDLLTVNASLAGLPGLALPCGFTKDNLPVGMQIIGPRWSEYLLFSVGNKYQKITDWHERSPRL